MSTDPKPATDCTRCPIMCGNTGTPTFTPPEGCPYPPQQQAAVVNEPVKDVK
jgi:hypothetical protein